MLNVFSKLRAFLGGQELLETERRRAVRLPCKFKAAVEGAPVTVVNISALGIRVEGDTKWRKAVVVSVNGRDHSGKAIFARVAWTQSRGSQYITGLAFVGNEAEIRESWVGTALDKLGAQKGKERRGHVRLNTEAVASLHDANGAPMGQGRLRNIGLGGALFLAEGNIQTGILVTLKLNQPGRPSLDETCIVRSCRKDPRGSYYFVGLQFHASGSENVRKFIKSR